MQHFFNILATISSIFTPHRHSPGNNSVECTPWRPDDRLSMAGSSTLVQSFKKVKNFKSPLFIDDLKFFCCQVLKFYVACVVCVAPLLYNILEVFDHETLV